MRKKEKGKGLSRGIRSREHLLHLGNGGDAQGSKKKKGRAGMGGHTLMKLVEGSWSPL